MGDIIDVYNSIKEDGGSITVTLVADKTVNPLTGVSSSATDVVISTYGVQTNFKNSDIDGTIIAIGDCNMIVPSYGLESLDVKNNKVRLRITSNSDVWKVRNIKTLSPYGEDIIYTFHMRK